MSLFHRIIPFILEHEYIGEAKPQQLVPMYYDMYWLDKWDDLGFPMAACMLDSTICHGIKKAEEWLKRSKGDYVSYLQYRLAYYKTTKEGEKWNKRMADLRRFIDGSKDDV